jgi:hypothetical protein
MITKMTTLMKEYDSIRFADALHWKRGKDWAHDANTEYEYRQDRLQDIMSELALYDRLTSLPIDDTPAWVQ